ncbi:MAG TPA: DUF2884 family protein [Gammaproteobacteria bacterium]|nr:DUF2884 family protein [Gammaproteobacteria bacterium]
MKKTGVVILLLSSCMVASADSSVCHFSSQYNIEVDENRVLFTKQGGSRYEFQRGNLVINDQQIKLAPAQQDSVTGIYETTRQLIPKLADVVAEAVELALKTITVITTSFFGGDEEIHQELTLPIEILADKIRENITADHFNADAMDRSFEEAFDKEFELLLSTALGRYAQTIGDAVAGLFSSEGPSIKDLALRLEDMGEQLQSYVEASAHDIRADAELLCQDFAQLDLYDDQLLGLKGYPRQGLIRTDEKGESRKSGINLDL